MRTSVVVGHRLLLACAPLILSALLGEKVKVNRAVRRLVGAATGVITMFCSRLAVAWARGQPSPTGVPAGTEGNAVVYLALHAIQREEWPRRRFSPLSFEMLWFLHLDYCYCYTDFILSYKLWD